MMHNGRWHERQWQRIEDEYGEPVQDVVRDYYYGMRLPMRQVADLLCISESTLRTWFRAWEWQTRRDGYIKRQVDGKVLRRARQLGYQDIRSAIGALRHEGKRWEDVKLILHCSDATLCLHYPESARGLHNVTPEGRQAKRESARRLNERMRRGEVRRGGYHDCPLGMVHPIGPPR
jgi:AraC-like DNA-binding protein